MVTVSYLNIPRYFGSFAGTDLSIWGKIVGCEVKHNNIGNGKIVEVFMKNDNIYIKINFIEMPEKDKLKLYGSKSFVGDLFESIDYKDCILEGFNDYCRMKVIEENELSIQMAIEEKKMKEQQKIQEEQARLEAKSLIEYNDLKIKYEIKSSNYNTITSPLYIILLKIDSKEELDQDDINWLEHDKLYMIIAIYYEIKFLHSNDLWDLVKACKYFRESNNPLKAIEVLDNKNTSDKKLMAAIRTTCGGAYRDINEIDKAETCAFEAIKANNTSFYPYNLLGALYYQKGMLEEGDEYFNRAIELGSSTRIRDSEIRKSMDQAGKDEKIRIAEYMLSKDPQKYGWVKYYLDRYSIF